MPIEETQESQQQKMEKLLVMFQHSDANPEEVKCLMKSTFYTQRQHVNQGKSIKCLREECPFWFDELGMSVHFKELTGIDLKETFTRNLEFVSTRARSSFRIMQGFRGCGDCRVAAQMM